MEYATLTNPYSAELSIQNLQRLIKSLIISLYTVLRWNIWWLCELSVLTLEQKRWYIFTEYDLWTVHSPETSFQTVVPAILAPLQCIMTPYNFCKSFLLLFLPLKRILYSYIYNIFVRDKTCIFFKYKPDALTSIGDRLG